MPRKSAVRDARGDAAALQEAPRPFRAARRPLDAGSVERLLTPLYGPYTFVPRYDPVEELVYTVLSQHTSDANSERAFKALRERFPDWDAVADAPVDEVEDAIRHGGLARVKAPRIQEVLRQVRERRGGFDLGFLADMPLADAKAWLLELPGVGPKTAACVLCFAMGLPALPVDTHVYRVSQRLGLVGPKTSADASHEILERALRPAQVYPFHMDLIQHGRQVCKAQRPACSQCVLVRRCPSAALAGPGPARRSTDR